MSAPFVISPVQFSELSHLLINIAHSLLEGGAPHPQVMQALRNQLSAAHTAQAAMQGRLPGDPDPYTLAVQLVNLKAFPAQLDGRIAIARVCIKNADALSVLLKLWIVHADRMLQTNRSELEQGVAAEIDKIRTGRKEEPDP